MENVVNSMKISIEQLRAIINEALSVPQEDLGDYELTEFRQFVAQFLKDNGPATQSQITTAWNELKGRDADRKTHSDAFRPYSTTTYDHDKFNKGSLVARGWLVPAGKKGAATLWKLSPRGEKDLLGSLKKVKRAPIDPGEKEALEIKNVLATDRSNIEFKVIWARPAIKRDDINPGFKKIPGVQNYSVGGRLVDRKTKSTISVYFTYISGKKAFDLYYTDIVNEKDVKIEPPYVFSDNEINAIENKIQEKDHAKEWYGNQII